MKKLSTESLSVNRKLYLKAKKAYYEDEPGMSDDLFDKLEDNIKRTDPNWPELKKTGVLPQKKTKRELDYFMPSLNKAYPEAIGKWLKVNTQGSFLAMDKLDGSSLQLTYMDGIPVRLVTRGNGTIGGDISFLIPHLNLPRTARKGQHTFRCEAVMYESLFQSKWKKQGFDNSRNLVNGMLNRKTQHDAMADIKIVVLGEYGKSLVSGFARAKELGLLCVWYAVQKKDTDLSALLASRKEKSVFNIDGLVVCNPTFKLVYESADKPEGIIAFKFNDEENAAQVRVRQIIWQLSGRRRLIPKIEIDPTEMDGVTVRYCTTHNAKWMIDRGIGPGATVKVLRSGGVIPKIVGVVVKGRVQPPAVAHEWDGVHYVAVDMNAESEKTIDIENLNKFMGTLGIELIAKKTLGLCYGALPTPLRYVRTWSKGALEETLLECGVGNVMSKKITAEFDRVLGAKIPMRKLMTAFQCFDVGIGERKLAMMEAAGFSLQTLTDVGYAFDSLKTVPGFAEKSAELILDGLPKWQKLYAVASKYLSIDGALPSKKKTVVGKLSGECVTFTGYRDKAQEAAIESAGGELVSFGAKTTLLIYKDGGKASSKVEAAKTKGIAVKTFAQLKF